MTLYYHLLYHKKATHNLIKETEQRGMNEDNIIYASVLIQLYIKVNYSSWKKWIMFHATFSTFLIILEMSSAGPDFGLKQL
jgi:hypothetical protein